MRLQYFLLILILAAAACGNDEDDTAYLGPIDGGPAHDAKPPPIRPPEPVSIDIDDCPSYAALTGPDGASVVRSIATLENRAVLTLNAELRSVQIGVNGCPGDPIEAFGTDGSLAIDAISAVALPGGRTLVATAAGMQLLDSAGGLVDDCGGLEGSMIARVLHASDAGQVAAVFTKSPVMLLELGMDASRCLARDLSLSPAPFSVAAIAMARFGGLVTVEQASATSPLVVARYDDAGVRIASSTAFASESASKLCSVGGMVDTSAGVFVTDTTCRRGVLFDREELFAIAVHAFDAIPRGVAISPDKSHVLVVVEWSSEGLSSAGFASIRLP